MKKKLVTVLLLLTLSAGAVACGGSKPENSDPVESREEASNEPEENKESVSRREEKTEEVSEPAEVNTGDENLNSHTIDGITISASTFSIEPYEDSSGSYTKRIVMEFTIKNESDSAFGYITSWDGKLSDGYKLKGWTDIMSMDLKQVPAGGEKTDTVYFLADDSVDPNEITVSYNFMDYGEEYWEDFGKIISGEMGEEEYMSKWGNYEVMEFTVSKE